MSFVVFFNVFFRPVALILSFPSLVSSSCLLLFVLLSFPYNLLCSLLRNTIFRYLLGVIFGPTASMLSLPCLHLTLIPSPRPLSSSPHSCPVLVLVVTFALLRVTSLDLSRHFPASRLRQVPGFVSDDLVILPHAS